MTIFPRFHKSRSAIEPPFATDLLEFAAFGILWTLILPYSIKDDGRIESFWMMIPFIVLGVVSANRRYRILEGLVACLAVTLPLVVAATLIVGGQEVLWLAGYAVFWAVLQTLLGWVRGFTG